MGEIKEVKKGITKKLTTADFVKKAQTIHGDKYDYSKVLYTNHLTKICIVCPTHSEFWQTPKHHLITGGCPKCSVEEYADSRKGKKIKHIKKRSTADFVKKAQTIHGDKYDYSKTEYVNNRKKLCIVCREHGEFWQTPYHHYAGKGCIECGGRSKLTTADFVKKAKTIHGDKFDYSKAVYTNNRTKLCIVCPSHGEFWQVPNAHYEGGCRKCNVSKGEKEISLFLDLHKIDYEKEVFVKSLIKHENLFSNQISTTRFDFLLKKYKIIIEFDGQQHFEPVTFGGRGKTVAINHFKNTAERDRYKDELAAILGYTMLRIPYWEMGNIQSILSSVFNLKDIDLEFTKKFNRENNQKTFQSFAIIPSDREN